MNQSQEKTKAEKQGRVKDQSSVKKEEREKQ